MSAIVQWVNTRIVEPVSKQIRSGASPEVLAKSFAFGITCGLFPIPGTTALVCAAATFLFKLNIVIPQVINLALTAVEVACIPLFFNFGNTVLGASDLTFSLSDLLNGLKTNFFETLSNFQTVLLRAVLGWAVFVAPATIVLYFALLPIMRRAVESMGRTA